MPQGYLAKCTRLQCGIFWGKHYILTVAITTKCDCKFKWLSGALEISNVNILHKSLWYSGGPVLILESPLAECDELEHHTISELFWPSNSYINIYITITYRRGKVWADTETEVLVRLSDQTTLTEYPHTENSPETTVQKVCTLIHIRTYTECTATYTYIFFFSPSTCNMNRSIQPQLSFTASNQCSLPPKLFQNITS